jgi:MscS family membrane protein
MRVRRLIQSFVLALLLCTPAFGQIPGLTALQSPPAAAKQEPAVPPDPLGRETPKGTLLGFIRAAQEERYNVAVQYFQPPLSRRRHPVEDDEEIAAQLLAILNQKFAGALDLISKDPLGRLDDGLPPDQEKVAGALGFSDKVPIILVREEDEEGRKLWYFSRNSLDHVPEIYDSLTFPGLEKKIPEALVTHRLLSMPLWQWLAMVLFIPVALLAGRMLTLGTLFLYSQWRKARGHSALVPERCFKVDPISLTFAILLHYSFVSYIGTSLIYRLYYRHLVWIFLAISFYWILTRITRAISARIGASFTTRGMLAERSIVSLIRRCESAGFAQPGGGRIHSSRRCGHRRSGTGPWCAEDI